MMSNLWQGLSRPILAMAPMEGVTDVAFREMFARQGKPDLFYTEFTSCDGLCSPGQSRVMVNLRFTERQRPILGHVFGKTPETFYKTAGLLRELDFDGIDINMGCPVKTICKNGEGAALMKSPELAREIIQACREGGRGLPVSVKTRLGYNHQEVESWIGTLLDAKPDAIALHGRTRKQMSKVPADWAAIGTAATLAKGTGVLILGNGDALSREDALAKAKEYQLDGVLIGRAAFGNPWLFHPTLLKTDLSAGEILTAMVEHACLFEHHLGGERQFITMRRHFIAYVSGFAGAKALKAALMETQNAVDAKQVALDYLNGLGEDTARVEQVETSLVPD